METVVDSDTQTGGDTTGSSGGRLARLTRNLPDYSVLLSGAIIVAILVLNCLDTFSRYVLNRPLNWAYDLSEALLVGMVFFALASVTAERVHIRFELLYERFSGRVLRLADFIHAIVGLGFFGFLAYSSVKIAYFSWLVGSLQGHLISIPRWIPMVVTVLGSTACCVALLSTRGHPSASTDEEVLLIKEAF